MAQLNFHNFSSNKTPPQRNSNLPIIQKLIATYKIWQEFLIHFPKTSRYTLGVKIDSIFIELIELLLTASYLGKDKKFSYIQRASKKIDLLKFLIQIGWEIKALDNKKYAVISKYIYEISNMIGGWYKQSEKQTPV